MGKNELKNWNDSKNCKSCHFQNSAKNPILSFGIWNIAHMLRRCSRIYLWKKKLEKNFDPVTWRETAHIYIYMGHFNNFLTLVKSGVNESCRWFFLWYMENEDFWLAQFFSEAYIYIYICVCIYFFKVPKTAFFSKYLKIYSSLSF